MLWLLLIFLLLVFACYIFWQIVYRTREMRSFGITLGQQAIWGIFILFAVFGLFASAIPRLYWAFPLFPIPNGIAYFIVPIFWGRTIRDRLIQHGTSRTRELEQIAMFSSWLGLFCVSIMAVTWLILLAGASISADSISR